MKLLDARHTFISSLRRHLLQFYFGPAYLTLGPNDRGPHRRFFQSISPLFVFGVLFSDETALDSNSLIVVTFIAGAHLLGQLHELFVLPLQSVSLRFREELVRLIYHVSAAWSSL